MTADDMVQEIGIDDQKREDIKNLLHDTVDKLKIKLRNEILK